MVPKAIKNLFLYSAGHTYSNLSRLFLRLFTGVMFLQLAIRQSLHINEIALQLQGPSAESWVVALVVVEILCAVFITLGFLTRVALFPSLALMWHAEQVILSSSATAADQLFNFSPGYPLMFMGIFVFMLLAGPGKVSLDYLIALHLTPDRSDEESAVLDKA